MSHARHIRERGRKQALRAATAAGMSLLVVAPAVAIAASADATTVSASSVANHVSGRNLVVNGSFEHGKLHWKKPATKKVKLKIKTRVATATKYARVTTTTARNVTLKTTAPVVSTATKGDVFHVSAQVRTNRPKVSGSVRAIETKGTSTRAVPEYFTLTRTAWTTVGFDVTATMTGSTFTTSVKSFNLPKGTTFDVDNVKVVKTKSASTPTPTPTTPTPTTPTPTTPTPTTPTPTTPTPDADPPTPTPTDADAHHPGPGRLVAAVLQHLQGPDRLDRLQQPDPEQRQLGQHGRRTSPPAPTVSRSSASASRATRQPFTSGEIVGTGRPWSCRTTSAPRSPARSRTSPAIWPCLLWFRPKNASDGEIDVMEWMGGMWTGDQKRVAITMHNEYGPGAGLDQEAAAAQEPTPGSTRPSQHTYTLEKVPG